MQQFKIRCSAIGLIMTEPKSKAAKEAGELSEGAKSYVKKWASGKFFDKVEDWETVYTRKGNVTEDEGIALIVKYFKLGMGFKNEKYFENDFLTGTPDFITKPIVYDNKSAFDVFTFPKYESKIKEAVYWWQGQGYMHLTGTHKYRICKTLVNTPDDIVWIKLRSECFKKGIAESQITEEMFQDALAHHKYDNYPIEERIKVYEFDYVPEAIELVKAKVAKCQEYFNELQKQKTVIKAETPSKVLALLNRAKLKAV